MKGTVAVICRPALAPGFRLASVPVHTAQDAEAAAEQVARLRDEGATSLLLVEDRLFADLPEPLREGEPLVVPFPGPTWREAAADQRVLDILRRAIGYRVRLR